MGRIILLPIAFVLAAVATLFVVFSLGQERVVQAISARSPDEVPIDRILDIVGMALRFATVYTLVPALLLVIVGEAARIRSAVYYIVGGGVALAVVPLLTPHRPAGDRAGAVARGVAGAGDRRLRRRLRLLAAGGPHRVSAGEERIEDNGSAQLD